MLKLLALLFISQVICNTSNLDGAEIARARIESEKIYLNSSFLLTVEVNSSENINIAYCQVPELSLPKGLTEVNASTNTDSDHINKIKYLFTIRADALGKFTLDGMNIKCQDKNDKENRVNLDKLSLTVVEYTLFGFKPIILILLIGMMIALTLLPAFLIRRRKNKKARIDENIEEMRMLEVKIDNAFEKLRLNFTGGDYPKFFGEIIKLLEEKELEGEELKLDELKYEMEKLSYGGYTPKKEELELIYKTVERSINSKLASIRKKRENLTT